MFARLTLTFALSSVSFCGPTEETALPPLVGTFDVTSTLQMNTCGQGGYALPSVTELEASVRGYPGESALFTWTERGAKSIGFATTGGVYSFESTAKSTAIAPEPALLYPGCELVENTAVTFTLTPTPMAPEADGGTDATRYTLSGNIQIDVSPSAGSDCTPLLGANGGTWAAMPCQAKIELRGTRTD